MSTNWLHDNNTLDFVVCLQRVRIKIRDGHSDFAVTNASWPAFCYPNSKQCSSQDIEKDLFRGELLVKVSNLSITLSHLRWYLSLGIQVPFSISLISCRRCWSLGRCFSGFKALQTHLPLNLFQCCIPLWPPVCNAMLYCLCCCAGSCYYSHGWSVH